MEDINKVYSERNRLAIAFCKVALLAGWKAGVRVDDNPEWDADWKNVVCIESPNGKQFCWHMSPQETQLIKNLPVFDVPWDGSFLAREPNWTDMLEF